MNSSPTQKTYTSLTQMEKFNRDLNGQIGCTFTKTARQKECLTQSLLAVELQDSCPRFLINAYPHHYEVNTHFVVAYLTPSTLMLLYLV